jgi:hypothetical protein
MTCPPLQHRLKVLGRRLAVVVCSPGHIHAPHAANASLRVPGEKDATHSAAELYSASPPRTTASRSTRPLARCTCFAHTVLATEHERYKHTPDHGKSGGLQLTAWHWHSYFTAY